MAKYLNERNDCSRSIDVLITSTPLVSSRTHAQLEEEDPVDEGAEAEGRSDQEEER
jgi:hypothetical protein